MNDRIRKLAEQAGWTDGYYASDDGPFVDPEFNKEKFAELIIAECCVALRPMLRDMISRTQAVDMIVTHFKDQE